MTYFQQDLTVLIILNSNNILSPMKVSPKTQAILLLLLVVNSQQQCTLLASNSTVSCISNLTCDRHFESNKSPFYLHFCLRNMDRQAEYFNIEVLNSESAEFYDAKINGESLASGRLAQFETPQELYEYLESNPSKIKFDQNGALKFPINFGNRERMKMIVTARRSMSMDTLLMLFKQLHRNNNQLEKNVQGLNTKVQEMKRENANQHQLVNTKFQEVRKENVNQQQLVNTKIEEVKRQNGNQQQVINKLNTEVQKLKPKTYTTFGNILNNLYLRTGKTKFLSENGFRLSQGPSTTSNDGINELWTWYQIIDGQYALISNNGKVLGGNDKNGVYYADNLHWWQRWRRIKLGNNRSLWLSFHNTYLSVNGEGKLYTVAHTAQLNLQSIWSDSIDN